KRHINCSGFGTLSSEEQEMKKCLVYGLALALVALFAFSDVAQAQRRGGWRGGGYYGDGYYSDGWGGRGGYGYYPFYGGYYSGNIPFGRNWTWSTPSSAWDWGTTVATDGYYGGGYDAYGNAPTYSYYGGYYDGDCGTYGYMGSSDGYYGA